MDKTGVLIKLFFYLILVKFQVIKWGNKERDTYLEVYLQKEVYFWLFCMNNTGYWCINKIVWQQIFFI